MTEASQEYPFRILDVAKLLQLKVRRHAAGSVYVNCPFCGDKRSRMNINYAKDVWRCNYCNEQGGMLALYAKYYHTSNGDAYREICEALQVGGNTTGDTDAADRSALPEPVRQGAAAPALLTMEKQPVPQATRAKAQAIHQTLSLMLGMLTLTPTHRRHLQSDKRGLNDAQIERFGFKSTPPVFLCRSLTERLLKQGCTVEGVPGFYQNKAGQWTVNFNSYTAGILIPAVGVDGLLCGLQILLDTPLRSKDDPPDKKGAKYIWLSSNGKRNGVTSGSPVHFVGDPFARTVYLTEGLLKADIAHCLLQRSFVAVAGAGNVGKLKPLFTLMARNGTRQIVECYDMDKCSNDAVAKGADKVYQLAVKAGLECQQLRWNPNYKGIDDWQLAKRREQEKEVKTMFFKQKYLNGMCRFEDRAACIAEWNAQPQTEEKQTLQEYLGLTDEENALLQTDAAALQALLDTQREQQGYRIYQLELAEGAKPVPFAFEGIEELHKAGYTQPPAGLYRMVWQGEMTCPCDQREITRLERIFSRFNTDLPREYTGRSLSVSDVVELYDAEKRRYYYCERVGFTPVQFSPFFAKGNTAQKDTK